MEEFIMLRRKENRIIKESSSSDVVGARELSNRIAEDMDSLQSLIKKINFALIQKMDDPQTEGVMNDLDSITKTIFKVRSVFKNATNYTWSDVDYILSDIKLR
jgi:hypothetical protein